MFNSRFWLVSVWMVWAMMGQAFADSFPEDQRKTILILSSVGGGGHATACRTLEQLVGEEYNLKVVYPINDLKIWGVPAGEQFYNMMLKKGWIRPMNFITRHMAPTLFHSRQKKLEGIIDSYIKLNHPDLLISLIPFVNYPASEAARKEHRPFLLITTDNDLRNWALDLQNVKHPLMKVTIGTELPNTKQLLLDKHIPTDAIETIGLPLRVEFSGRKDRKQVCESLQLPTDMKRILILMGAVGGPVAYEYSELIGKMPLGVNLVVVAGRNEILKQELEELTVDATNTLTVFGYTERIADLMAVSDLMITKPGPGTINEAMAMKLPMLIDNTQISLFWERINVDMVTGYGVGQKVKRLDQLEEWLTQYFQEPNIEQKKEQVFLHVPTNQFHIRIPQIIKELIAENEKLVQALQLSDPDLEKAAPQYEDPVLSK